MTKGSVVRSIFVFAVPCILGKILQNLYTLVDSVIVGQVIDLNALAAVGATSSILSLFTETTMGLMAGFSVTASNKYGSGNMAAVKKVFANSLLVTVAVSVLLTVSGALFSRKLLMLMNTPAEILDDATTYLTLSFLGISAMVFYNFLCEMLKALGNSRKPLLFLLIASVLHLLLIFVFSVWCKMGIAGAAYSTVLSQAFAVLVSGCYIHKRVPELKITRKDLKPDRQILAECFHISIPMAVTNFVVMFGVIILSFVTNKIGTEYVAAYTCASRIGYIMTTPIFGFVAAASVFVSQNYGAGEIDRIHKGVRQTSLLITAVNCVLFVVLLFVARPLLSLLLQDGELAVNAGVTYLYIRGTAMFVLTFAAMYKSVLTALGRPLFPTISGFLEVAVRYVVPITLYKTLGFLSVPITDAVSWLMLALFLAPVYVCVMKKVRRKRALSAAE